MEKILPKKYEDRKILVSGGLGFAWDRQTMLEFSIDPAVHKFAILGGDVLEHNESDGEYKTNYDNWFINRNGPGETFEDYCKRSRAKAFDYVNSYNDSERFVFAPVLSNELTAGLFTID